MHHFYLIYYMECLATERYKNHKKYGYDILMTPMILKISGRSVHLGLYSQESFDFYRPSHNNFIFRWVLFPPTDDLGPTRLPYEESSVFSSFDFISPSSDRLCNTHPHVIILEPGDVLFVPPKWWHFVQSISDDFTISVNTWIDTPGPDREAKTMEALTQLLMAFMMKSESNDAQRYVIGDDRPAQIPEVETSLDILNAVLSSNSETVPEEDVVLNDFLKRWRPVGTEAQPMKDIDEFCHYMRRNCSLDVGDQEAERKPRKADKEDILKAMTHPDTVRVIFDQLMKLKN